MSDVHRDYFRLDHTLLPEYSSHNDCLAVLGADEIVVADVRVKCEVALVGDQQQMYLEVNNASLGSWAPRHSETDEEEQIACCLAGFLIADFDDTYAFVAVAARMDGDAAGT